MEIVKPLETPKYDAVWSNTAANYSLNDEHTVKSIPRSKLNIIIIFVKV